MSKGRSVPPRVESAFIECRHHWEPVPDRPGVYCGRCRCVAFLNVQEVMDRGAFVLEVHHPEGKDLRPHDVQAAAREIVSFLRPVLHKAPVELQQALQTLWRGA
jgi:hypothetical protein